MGDSTGGRCEQNRKNPIEIKMGHRGKSQDESKEAATNSVPSSPSAAASPYWGKSTQTSTKPEGFSPLVGFCFTINYILGTGFLTIPWAFTQGGLVLSTIMIIMVGVFSDMTKNFLLETMARAEAMLDNQMHWIKRNPGDEEKQRLIYSPVIIKGETSDLLQSAAMSYDYGISSMPASANNSSHGVGRGSSSCELSALSLPAGTSGGHTPTNQGRHLVQRAKQKYLVKHRKFEINSLCRVFLGKIGLRIYTGFICIYVYCLLWAYTSVFASSMARAAPLFADGDTDTNYLIFAIVFAAMVVPMSCMEMDEQVVVQVAMTGARFLMLGLMLGTSSLCAQDIAREESFVEAPMFQFSGLSKMAPVMVFAHVFHHSIPGLAHPVADKKELSGMFRSTTVFSTIAYALIGLILGSNFGGNIEQSSNLNWKNFSGGTAVYNDDGQIISIAWWAKAISLYVLCFPALDVISAFPLNAITLGNNMMGSFYGKRIHEVEQDRRIRTQFRLLASIPPIIFGILERQLGTITEYAGTTGFVIGFSFPALLYLRSRALAERKHFSISTFYTGYSSSNPAGWFLFSFGLAMAMYVVFFLIRGEDSDDES
mmetsp:Transcript_30360/g.55006  ORF Transcript_30360/g.55006 Transcript_30360/m.55006 type:complete len:597 (+) Transcript_30360:137-1927(+)